MIPQPDTRQTISVGKKWLADLEWERNNANEALAACRRSAVSQADTIEGLKGRAAQAEARIEAAWEATIGMPSKERHKIRLALSAGDNPQTRTLNDIDPERHVKRLIAGDNK